MKRMSEDRPIYEPRYRVLMSAPDGVSAVQRNDVLGRFLEELGKTSPIKLRRETSYATSYITPRGLATAQVHDNGDLSMIAFRHQDVPGGEWYAGELALRALRAAEGVLPRESVRLTLWNRKQVRDLVTITAQAALGDKPKYVRAGVVPLHFTNGRTVHPSENLIKDLEEYVISDFQMQQVQEKTAVTYETTVAYAWHWKHGILPGFNSREVPKGLDWFTFNKGAIQVLPDAKRA